MVTLLFSLLTFYLVIMQCALWLPKPVIFLGAQAFDVVSHNPFEEWLLSFYRDFIIRYLCICTIQVVIKTRGETISKIKQVPTNSLSKNQKSVHTWDDTNIINGLLLWLYQIPYSPLQFDKPST